MNSFFFIYYLIPPFFLNNIYFILFFIKIFNLSKFLGRVGKTSLILRFCKDTFSDKQESTLEASNILQNVRVDEDVVSLDIWV